MKVNLTGQARLSLYALVSASDVPAGDDSLMEFYHDLKNKIADKVFRSSCVKALPDGSHVHNLEVLDSYSTIDLEKLEVAKLLEVMDKTPLKAGDSDWAIPTKKALKAAKEALSKQK